MTVTEVAACFATETLSKVDKEDLEDNDWCGKMQRNVFVMRTAARDNRKRKEIGDSTGAHEATTVSIGADEGTNSSEEHTENGLTGEKRNFSSVSETPVKSLTLADSISNDDQCILNDTILPLVGILSTPLPIRPHGNTIQTQTLPEDFRAA
jgi:hypothetical protein